MPQLDLTTLSGPELRQLLDSVRARGQAAQSYEILQEMARRREGRAPASRRPSFGGRGEASGAAPHIIDLNLGDPLESRLAPWEAEAEAEAEALDADVRLPPAGGDSGAQAEPPLTLGSGITRGRRPDAPPPSPRPRRAPGASLGFALGALAGLVLGIGVGGSLREALVLPSEPEELPPMTVVDRPSTASSVTGLHETAAPELEPAPELAPEPEAASAHAGAPPAAPGQDVPDAEPAGELDAEPQGGLEAVAVGPSLSVSAGACASEPTPADRTICGDPALQQLQKALRRAYAEALAAHADRDLLRQRQLAWRDARSSVTDPATLAALYEARIGKLNAATADARSRR